MQTTTRGLVRTLLELVHTRQTNIPQYLYFSDEDRAHTRPEALLQAYVRKHIPDIQEDSEGNLYKITAGTPLLCAHLDNVGSEAAQDLLRTASVCKGRLQGLANIGADDKNGVAIALQLYKHYGDRISVLFTTGEEVGGIGSSYFAKHNKELLQSCTYCIIADRRGSSDVIGAGNDYCTEEYEAAVLPILSQYGYKTATGVYCDADNLAEHINCINLSCGYYDPHTDKEYVDVAQFLNCYNAIEALVLQYNDRLLPAIQNKYDYRTSYKYSYTSADVPTAYEPLYIADGVLYVLEDVQLVKNGRIYTLDAGDYEIYDKDNTEDEDDDDDINSYYGRRSR